MELNQLPRFMVAIAILGNGDSQLLEATLSNYKSLGLLELFKEKIVFYSSASAGCKSVAKKFGFKIFVSEEVDQSEYSADTWRRFFNNIKSKYVFFLEEGCPLVNSGQKVMQHLRTCFYLLNHNKVNIVRLAHGSKTDKSQDIVEQYKEYYEDKKESKFSILKFLKRKINSYRSKKVIGASVYIYDNPENVHPNEIIRYNDYCFITSSRYLEWTGRSIIINKQWMLDVILAKVAQSFFSKKDLHSAVSSDWWDQQNFPIAICKGLFSEKQHIEAV